MPSLFYNDLRFGLDRKDGGWDITCSRPDGVNALVGTGLFAGLAENEAEARAWGLIKTIFPVGVRSVGPDVGHPITIGDLKIIGPDVAHPGFIHWPKESVSYPKEPGSL